MLSVGTAIAYLDLDTSKFSSGLKSAGKNLQTFTDSSKSFDDRLGGLGSAMGKVGSMATTHLTLPIVGAGAAILKYSSDFESGMAKVQAISGASTDDMERLSEKAKEMGATTKFSASESADAFQYMAMAGWKTDQMLNSISGIMNLAAADGLDLASTSDIVTDAMTALGIAADGTTTVIRDGFNVEVSNAEHFADVLAMASSSANTNVHMLGESFKYVAPTAGALGYSVEDVSIALGLMANAGVKAGRGGTSLNNILTNLAKPTDTMANAMDYLGISLQDEEGRMLSLREVLIQFRESMGDINAPTEEFSASLEALTQQYEDGTLTEKKYNEAVEELIDNTYSAEDALKAKYAATIAGKEGMAGLLAIVNTSDKDFETLVNAIDNADGKAQEMADIMNNTAEGQIVLFQSAVEGLALSFSQFLLPTFTEIVKAAAGFVGTLSQMDEDTKQIIVTVALFVAALGPVMLIISKLIGGFLSIKTVVMAVWPIVTGFFTGSTGLVGLITGLAGPVGIMIALVAALMAAWVTNFGGIRDKTAEILTYIQEIIQVFIDFAVMLWEDGLKAMLDTASSAWGDIKVAFEVAIELIKNIFKLFADVLRGDWSAAWVDIKNILSNSWELLMSILKAGIKLFVGAIIDLAGLLFVESKKAFAYIWEGLKAAWALLMEWFNLARNDPIKALEALKDALVNAGKNTINWLWDGLKSAWESVKNWFEGIGNWITEKLNFWKNSASEARSARDDVADVVEYADSGSGKPHKNGLDYVPYDGYKAILHKGERVLTADENKAYNGRSGESQGNQTFNFYGAPPLNEKETARQFKKSQQQLALYYN